MNVIETITRRTSCRAYRPDPIPREHLERLVEAVRLAPSACNRQPWRLVIAQKPELRQRIVEAGFLPGIRMPWAGAAPVLIVLGMQRSLVTHRLGAWVSGVNYPWMDIGIAGEHLVLAATELGLGTCWIGWIKPRVLGHLVGWPRTIRAAAVITIGYPESTPVAAAASTRKPASEIACWL